MAEWGFWIPRVLRLLKDIVRDGGSYLYQVLFGAWHREDAQGMDATAIRAVNQPLFARCFLPSENQVPKKGNITKMWGI